MKLIWIVSTALLGLALASHVDITFSEELADFPMDEGSPYDMTLAEVCEVSLCGPMS
jgi:hypothetical protein